MKTRTVSVDITVPEVSAELRSSATAITGTCVIGAICGLVVARAAVFTDTFGSPGAAAVSAVCAVAVFLSMLRWVPSLSDDSMRPVPRRHASALLAACVGVAVVAVMFDEYRVWLVGLLSTLSLLNVYLACWGYRALFLLRRMVTFSVLSWPAASAALYSFVSSSLEGPSDMMYRRLDYLGVSGDRPWRMYSAMTDRAAVAVIAAVVLVVALSRIRLSLSLTVRLVLAGAAVMAVHHVTALSLPLERYEPLMWSRLALNPVSEVALGAIAALVVLWSTSPSDIADGVTTAAADRDPEIFGVHGIANPVLTMRVFGLLVPALLLCAVVVLP